MNELIIQILMSVECRVTHLIFGCLLVVVVKAGCETPLWDFRALGSLTSLHTLQRFIETHV